MTCQSTGSSASNIPEMSHLAEENQRLKKLLTEAIAISNQRGEKINDLKKENAAQASRINKLESKCTELKTKLTSCLKTRIFEKDYSKDLKILNQDREAHYKQVLGEKNKLIDDLNKQLSEVLDEQFAKAKNPFPALRCDTKIVRF